MKALKILKELSFTLSKYTSNEDIIEAIAELERLKADYNDINNAYEECIEKYESIAYKQIALESKTCDNCKYGRFGADSIGIELECYLSWDCSRGRIDKWESKEC